MKAFVFSTIDLLIRPLLAPFKLARRVRPPAPAAMAAVAGKPDEFNRAADEYYVRQVPAVYVANKPFSEPEMFAKRMIDVGILVDGLRLRPGHVVLELGAGSCWLSHFLNRFGCRTISVDVSPAALAIGRQMFEQDPHTHWTLDPQFVSYDGHALPIASASVDAAILYDTYHHLPNPPAVLKELRRVLKNDGIVGMSEPGRGHARSAQAALESGATGVLENELVLDEIVKVATAAGFQATQIIVASRTGLLEIDAARQRDFIGGHRFTDYWRQLGAALDGHHYILLHRGDPRPSTSRPRRLMADLTLRAAGAVTSAAGGRMRVARGAAIAVEVRARNIGDTRWLHAADRPGWTRLGAHLYEAATMRAIDFDWVRVALPVDVAPGDEAVVTIPLPSIAEAGNYLVSVDLVVEGLTWFADRDSHPATLRIDVP